MKIPHDCFCFFLIPTLKYPMMKPIALLAFLLFCLASCAPAPEQQYIVAVKGQIPVEEMGTTLIHEHVLVDWIGADSTGNHRWDNREVVARALPFLMAVKEQGVSTFLDCTPAYLGRDPLLLKELSEKTGLNILTNTGYYGAGYKFVPKHAFDDHAEDIARVWIDEFENGIDGTGVFPGFIKISVAGDDTLSPLHAKIVKAAALAHKATGLAIVSHTGPDAPAFAQLEILKGQGVSPEAFVWTHAQQGTFEGYLKAAKLGAWISIDNVNSNNGPDEPGGISWFVSLLVQLRKENVLGKVLISHDAGWYNVGQEDGGYFRGYTDIFEYLLPKLRENGFDQGDIDILLVKNPQKAYSIAIRGL
jgi:phosphotriesterase-related protein